MLQSIYTPLSGANAQEKVLEVIANNLANINTAGFKGDGVSFSVLDSEPNHNYSDPLPPANYKQSLEDVMPFHGNEIQYTGVAEVYRDNLQGPAISTSNPTDLMIEGDGYFAIQTTEGTRYTRAGNLSLSPDGVLMNVNGQPVLGEKGNIVVKGTSFEVNPLGEVYQNGELVDRLMIHSFKNTDQLERIGNNQFFYQGAPGDVSTIEHPTIRQGFLEGSNVNAIKNLTAMIVAHRSFEAYQKAISNYDRMMDKSSNTIGEVRA